MGSCSANCSKGNRMFLRSCELSPSWTVHSLLMGPRHCSGTWGTADCQVCYWAAATGFGFSPYKMGYFTHCCEIFTHLETVFKQPALQLHSSSYPSRKSLKAEAGSLGLAGPVVGLCSLQTSQNAVAGEEAELEWLFYFRGGHPRLRGNPCHNLSVSTGFGTSWNSL